MNCSKCGKPLRTVSGPAESAAPVECSRCFNLSISRPSSVDAAGSWMEQAERRRAREESETTPLPLPKSMAFNYAGLHNGRTPYR